MTKVLNSEQYIKEAYMGITKTITDKLDLDMITVRCSWDGESWYYFDREGKGSIEDFKALDKNKNTHLEIELKYYFELSDDEGELSDSATIESLVVLHYSDMSIDDYDIDVKYVRNTVDLVEITEDYEVSAEELNEVFSESWTEQVTDELISEFDDKLGIDQYSNIYDEIKEKAIKAVMDDYISKVNA